MNFKLDQAFVAEITQEARQCFLSEDAPQYLQVLESVLQQGPQAADFTSLLRAAHSLKGGAGLAKLTSLQELAHKLENLIQALAQGQVPELEGAWMLLELSVTEVAFMLHQAQTSLEVVADPELLEALANFERERAPEPVPRQTNKQLDNLVRNSLKQDLEASFARVELLSSDAPSEAIRESLEAFCEECLFWGETLEVPWLIEAIESFETMAQESSPDTALALAQQLIARLRRQRDQYLELIGKERDEETGRKAKTNTKLEPKEKITSSEEIQPLPQQEKAPLSHLRIPLKRLENMTTSIEELLLAQERLRLQQKQLEQANIRLRQLARQFEPIQEQVQAAYDRLAINSTGVTSLNGAHNSSTARQIKSVSDLDFDPMELDRFSNLHSSLQSFQELMVQVQETRTDFDLINRELTDNLEQVEKNLDALYGDVTKSRLVPFRLLAQRFLAQIQHLNRRYHKSTRLVIEGEDVLVDQVLLEQLQTPLTHLLNNAFDHGIESSSERLANRKPEVAEIILAARVDDNQLVISLKDDGRGIDLQKIYQRGREIGLCSPQTAIEQLSEQEILDWIFQPHFSTAKKVSELSGRGMGLDIVRSQIQRLRGTIQVDTQLGHKTFFTLQLPLNLSLLSLLLVKLQQHLVAIPTASVLATIPVSELSWHQTQPATVNWQQQTVPVVPLSNLLPYSRPPLELSPQQVAIVLNAAFGPLVVTVDALISQGQLIIKPFDDTIATPPYLAGCTILGTGELAPVILPQAFHKPSSEPQSPPRQYRVMPPPPKPTILVVEDSVATRRFLARLLSQVGYNVVVCRDGQEALDKLHQHQGEVKLILSDIEMPRLNGFELLRLLRSQSSWRQIPVVIVTSRTGEHHQQQAKKLGTRAYLGKPVQPQELLTTIENILNGSN